MGVFPKLMFTMLATSEALSISSKLTSHQYAKCPRKIESMAVVTSSSFTLKSKFASPLGVVEIRCAVAPANIPAKAKKAIVTFRSKLCFFIVISIIKVFLI